MCIHEQIIVEFVVLSCARRRVTCVMRCRLYVINHDRSIRRAGLERIESSVCCLFRFIYFQVRRNINIEPRLVRSYIRGKRACVSSRIRTRSLYRKRTLLMISRYTRYAYGKQTERTSRNLLLKSRRIMFKTFETNTSRVVCFRVLVISDVFYTWRDKIKKIIYEKTTARETEVKTHRKRRTEKNQYTWYARQRPRTRLTYVCISSQFRDG